MLPVLIDGVTHIIGDLEVNRWGIGDGNIHAMGNVQTNGVLINSSQELKQDISQLSYAEAYKLKI